MKSLFYSLLLLTVLLSSCGKDKFECGAETNMAPADDSSVLFIPTAFSPDGNGCNDMFKIQTINIDSIHIEIYDTDNNLKFETSDLAWGWLPDNFETGLTLYHYKVTAKSHQGYNYYRCGDLYSYKCLPNDFDTKKLTFGDQFDPSKPGYFNDSTTCEVFAPCK